jgi:galactokinase
MNDAALRQKVTAGFARHFAGLPDITVRAPGRVNLIGEHTDYNDGFVLPCAIGPATMVAARSRHDGQVNVVALDFDAATDSFAINMPIEKRADAPWSDYVRGTLDSLIRHGHNLTGADMVIAGNLPQGAGLSSSASLEIATGYAMLSLAGQEIDLSALAKMAQSAECDFVGCQCGIMDQLVSARGTAGHALLIDCRSLEVRDIAVADTIGIMIVHSGVSRGLVDGAYNERRLQCEDGARAMGVAALRDADTAMLAGAKADMETLTFLRARHVISENARTLDAAEALTRGDLVSLGTLMAASHGSMRDDFAITVPAIDRLVAILQSAIGDEGGARMTGGGFGGAVVGVMAASRMTEIADIVRTQYTCPDGSEPLILMERPGSGVALL